MNNFDVLNFKLNHFHVINLCFNRLGLVSSLNTSVHSTSLYTLAHCVECSGLSCVHCAVHTKRVWLQNRSDEITFPKTSNSTYLADSPEETGDMLSLLSRPGIYCHHVTAQQILKFTPAVLNVNSPCNFSVANQRNVTHVHGLHLNSIMIALEINILT